MIILVRLSFLVLFFLFSFQHAIGSWVDPDTPEVSRTTESLFERDSRTYEIVFSDEFEKDGRNFHDGNDPRWTAIHKNDYTNLALHYYQRANAETKGGVLSIKTEIKENAYRAFNEKTKKFYNDKKYIQSAMLQGWNKFCFTGGIVEFSAKLPGSPRIGGLWPALWLLGNLARATYVGSSDYVWPYSYNQCDKVNRLSQEINACSKLNHYGMQPYHGRGAPEIDVIEAMQGDAEKLPSTTIRRPYQSSSFQVSPGIDRDRPVLGMEPKQGHWYTGMEYNNENRTKSELNPFFYGVTLVHKLKSYTYQADALSANLGLSTSHYINQHIYRVEWEPPSKNGTGGYIRWYTDSILMYGISGSNLHTTGSEIPSEAMYLLMNTAVASSWGFPAPCPEGCKCSCFECGNSDCACALPTGYCENFPATFEIDYVRVFQALGETKHILGCSPEDRPTSLFIKGHQERYTEIGQSMPLQPIKKGGNPCRHNAECGTIKHGQCTPRGLCACKENFTGPNCLAHAGFYINESISETKATFGWHKFYLPFSLVAWIIFLCLLLVYSAYLAVRDRLKHSHRNKGRHVYCRANKFHSSTSPTKLGLTNQDSFDYALPPKQKVVTYCVVDGKLLN